MDTSRVDGVKAPQHFKTPRSCHFHDLHDALDVLVELQLEEVGQAEAGALVHGFMTF